MVVRKCPISHRATLSAPYLKGTYLCEQFFNDGPQDRGTYSKTTAVVVQDVCFVNHKISFDTFLKITVTIIM